MKKEGEENRNKLRNRERGRKRKKEILGGKWNKGKMKEEIK